MYKNPAGEVFATKSAAIASQGTPEEARGVGITRNKSPFVGTPAISWEDALVAYGAEPQSVGKEAMRSYSMATKFGWLLGGVAPSTHQTVNGPVSGTEGFSVYCYVDNTGAVHF
ncbi:MAG: hypothetical protein ABJN62_18695 [Halioglobus sp.]